MNNNTRVPQLRFPEFKNSGEWKKKRFIDVADKNVKWSFSGGPFGSDLKSSDYTNAGVRVIQLQNIGDGSFINKNVVYTSKNKADKLISCNIYPDEIILSKMGDPVGRASIIPNIHSRYLMCSDGIRLVVDKEHYNNYFIFSFINHPNFRKLIESSSTGSTRKRIGLGILKKLPAVLPKEKLEQQKIADCLSSLDDLITAHTEKLDTLKDHKKGLMQNLFPTDGEKVPKLRFPEFENRGEWVEKRFGDLCNFVRGPFGGALKKDFFVKEGFAVYEQAHAIYNKFDSFRYFITSEKFTELKRFAVSPNDIIMSCSGTMGKFAIIPSKTKIGVINQALLKLTVKKKYNLQFTKYTLELPSTQNKLLSQSAGGAIKNVVGVSQMKEIELIVPPSLPEQKKIATCLSTIDEQITAQAEKIEALKEHKKGLMQGLFPQGSVKSFMKI
jgi:type I restriction enzyme S subunit